MSYRHVRTLVAPALALGVSLTLGACSVGPVNLDDFLMNTSVEEARAARAEGLTQSVDDSLLKQAGTLTVGIPATESAPLVITTGDGSRVGLDIDTAHALADALGLASVSFVSVTDTATALQESCDVVMGVSVEAAGSTAIVGNYVQSATGLFTTQDVTAPIDASALAGAVVGVQEGSVSQRILAELGTGATESTFANLNEAFEALRDGTVNYVACDAYAGAYLANASDDVFFAGTLDDSVITSIAVASPELQSAVQTALDSVQTNGVGDILRSRWVGALPVLSETTKVTGIVVPAEPAEDEGDSAEGEGEQGDESGTPDEGGTPDESDATDDLTPAE